MQSVIYQLNVIKHAIYYHVPPSLFEPMKIYELQGFKLKKGFGSSELEIVIDDTTQVQLSENQFKMKRCSFNIGKNH